MGDPGTKELLSLAELEAAAGVRTGRKHVLSILVENKPGVLTRIAGLFARRGEDVRLTLATVAQPDDDPAALLARLEARAADLRGAPLPYLDPDPAGRFRVATACS